MEAVAAIASAAAAFLALCAGYINWRRRELRREEVHAWANRVIEALQTVVLICVLDPTKHSSESFEERADKLVFETSILVEQGRLFFKNIVRDTFGAEKPKAYRGYRPEILDHLVVAHQIACAWRTASPTDLTRMGDLAMDRLRRFVSAMQAEVGRGRTASEDTEAAGFGINLGALLASVPATNVTPRPHL